MEVPERPSFDELTDLLIAELTEHLDIVGATRTGGEARALAGLLAEAIVDRFTVVARAASQPGSEYEWVRWPTNFGQGGVGTDFIAMLMERSAIGLELLTAIPSEKPGEHFLVFKGRRPADS